MSRLELLAFALVLVYVAAVAALDLDAGMAALGGAVVAFVWMAAWLKQGPRSGHPGEHDDVPAAHEDEGVRTVV